MIRKIAFLLCVAGTTAAHAETLTLTTGETIKGTIVSQDDAQVVVQHPMFGQLTVPRESIVAIVAEPAEGEAAPDVPAESEAVAGVVAEPPEEPTPEPELKPESEPTGFFAGWSNRLEIGFNVSEGNTENSDFRVGFGSTKENDRHRWKADASYYLEFDEGDRTDHAATAGLLKDWLYPDSRWFWYALGRVDFDEFEAWDWRTFAGGGVGYHLVQEESLTIDLRGGAGLLREFGSEDDNLRPEGQLGIEGEWRIDDRQSIVADAWFYPDLGDLGEYRTTASAAWQIKIDARRGMSLKLGVENEYESEVDPGNEKNDFKAFGAFVFEF